MRLNMDNSFIIAGIIICIFSLSYIVFDIMSEAKWKQGYNQAMSLRKVDDRMESKIDILLEGIDGVQSVNLSSKRYVELLQKEEELNEIKLKIKEVVNEPI